ncbi:MAG: hypothetical protein NT031_06770, partial [Planctomycetota bacterium]|nr:hypothetical protein [Planctomycetota bacterium]
GGGYSARPGARTRRRAAVGLGCALAAGALAALAMGSYQPTTVSADGELVGGSGIVLLEPETWVGGRFPLLGHITVGEKLSHGRWIVVLFARGCPGCAEALPRYQKMAAGSAARGEPAVALVEIPRPHHPDAPEPARQAGPLWGRLDDRKDWFVTTPVVLLLADGVVKAAWEGKAPPWEQLVRGLR